MRFAVQVHALVLRDAELVGNRVRRIKPDGIVTTLAVLGALIGAVSFTGSCVAYAKLQGLLKRAIRLPAQNVVNVVLALAAVALGVAMIVSAPARPELIVGFFALALLLPLLTATGRAGGLALAAIPGGAWFPASALLLVIPAAVISLLVRPHHALAAQALLLVAGCALMLTVVALGVGIGVDYAIYIFARMREAMGAGMTLTESYFSALKTTGIAVFYTALTLAVGVGLWIFSDLKFQADMGVLLTFMFVVNMIAALVFLPALCRWLLRPRERAAG